MKTIPTTESKNTSGLFAVFITDHGGNDELWSLALPNIRCLLSFAIPASPMANQLVF